MSPPPGGLAAWLRRRWLPLVALIAAAAIAAGLVAASPWQRPGGPPPAVEPALAAVLGAGAPGLVAQVWGDGSWAEAEGLADLARRTPMRPGDRFRIASLTKTYVAAVTLQLVAGRRLGLDDPVARYLPGLLRDGAQITVRELLNHTSGLVQSARLPEVQRAARDNGVVPASEQVRLAGAQPRSFAPGTGWNYTNTGYLVAGLLIERVTGQRLGQVLADRLFGPLHLTATTFEPQPGIPAGIAHGYWPGPGSGAVDATESVGGGAWAAGAIVSTASDVARFYAALLSGRVLPARLLAQMRSTVTPTQGGYGDAYGLGLARFDLPCGPAWGHIGNLASYTAVAAAAPDGHRVAVVLVNGFTRPPGSNERVLMTMLHAAGVAYCRR
jgi:D-alanyl-D-alanine carboxypeptidase